MIRPENLKLITDATRTSHVNRLQARVENVSFTGNIVNYFVRLDGQADLLRVQSTPPVCVHRGEEVGIAFAPEDCVLLKA
jgi:ABC-type Fe3+/spermidine/putrescine transport system ATPase subunit